MIARDPEFIALCMRDNVRERVEVKELAKVREKLDRRLVCTLDVRLCFFRVVIDERRAARVLDRGGLGHFNADMSRV